MSPRPRPLAGVLLLGLALFVACSAPCEESLGTYPPPVVVVTGVETVEVPHIGWTCEDFHSDSLDPPPVVPPDADGILTVKVSLEPGSTIEARFGNDPVGLDPAAVDGSDTFLFRVPDPPQPLVIQLCSQDRRCAMYWVNTY